MLNLSRGIVIISLFLLSQPVFSPDPLNIVINEISWMGTVESSNDEWMELYNNTGSAINLNDWVLKSADDVPKINLQGEIKPGGFYLLERTDDNTLSDITADQIYTGALENAGEKLELYDNAGNLIDSVDCRSGW